ncbi:hypothetical protein [Portibacter lacus]|uniref:Uncharacterized protein n=1 Tax=Portibacter lacus TaxID=1099794 RepID=A0AA37SV93_9BACT|nr:hypothetical protein [Portibacter lacus]GLR19870.1 hypothetical protein GCM10007940_44860 [Portibacter lacus]
MSKLILISICILLSQTTYSQAKKVIIDGAIVISDSEETTPQAGTIRWNGQDFQGYDGNQWRTFTYVVDTNVTDDFSGSGPLLNYSTNNETALPGVTRDNGRYRAEVLSNANNVTLHFNGSQGRLDAKVVTFPFEYIVRNIGIGTLNDSQTAPPDNISSYVFAGIQAHVYPNFESRNSSHFVVGHRGNTENTIEGKNTVNGSSSVNDAGANVVPDGRADLRLVGQSDNTILWYYQVPNFDVGNTPDNWIPYRGTGLMPGTAPVFGDTIYLGPITYAFNSSNVPFVGTIDSIELIGENP